MSDQKYNGWTNRETWMFNLWVGDCEMISEHAAYVVETNAPDERLHPMSCYLMDLVEEMADQFTTDNKGFMCDLLQVGIDRIDWLELSSTYLAAAIEENGDNWNDDTEHLSP